MKREFALSSCLAMTACYSGLDGQSEPDLVPPRAPGHDGGQSPDDDGDDGDDDGGDADVPSSVDEIASTGLRRLTSAEYDATVRDLLDDPDPSSVLLLPEDPRNPFDNDFTIQVASQALIEGADLLARDLAAKLVADPPRRNAVLGCIPDDVVDAACFEQFVTTFGRRALRRPLTSDEVDALVGLLDLAVEADDFDAAVQAAVGTLLQHPEFLYRVEVGAPVADHAGLFRLDDWEIATRLSYLLWGTTPDDALLDRAAAGELSPAAERRATAEQMLDDPRAIARVSRFHALWMGYEQLPHDAELSAAMKAETDALLQRVIFDERAPWQDLLRASETYVDPTLAEHYGLPNADPDASQPSWVSYAGTERQGLLSHGSFLSLGAAFDDTSPVQRGLLIRTRLFCEDVPPPPPDVNVDDPPDAENAMCKWDLYAAHREQGACAGCHQLLDPVGFGLENYDAAGRFRSHESDKPHTPEDESQCAIEGQGEIVGIGEFRGPGQLGELMIESGRLNQCVATQLYRFAMGKYALDDIDRRIVERLIEHAGEGDFAFDDLMLELIASDTFAFRTEEQP